MAYAGSALHVATSARTVGMSGGVTVVTTGAMSPRHASNASVSHHVSVATRGCSAVAPCTAAPVRRVVRAPERMVSVPTPSVNSNSCGSNSSPGSVLGGKGGGRQRQDTSGGRDGGTHDRYKESSPSARVAVSSPSAPGGRSSFGSRRRYRSADQVAQEEGCSDGGATASGGGGGGGNSSRTPLRAGACSAQSGESPSSSATLAPPSQAGAADDTGASSGARAASSDALDTSGEGGCLQGSSRRRADAPGGVSDLEESLLRSHGTFPPSNSSGYPSAGNSPTAASNWSARSQQLWTPPVGPGATPSRCPTVAPTTSGSPTASQGSCLVRGGISPLGANSSQGEVDQFSQCQNSGLASHRALRDAGGARGSPRAGSAVPSALGASGSTLTQPWPRGSMAQIGGSASQARHTGSGLVGGGTQQRQQQLTQQMYQGATPSRSAASVAVRQPESHRGGHQSPGGGCGLVRVDQTATGPMPLMTEAGARSGEHPDMERTEFMGRIEALEAKVVDRDGRIVKLSRQQARLDRLLETLARENELLKSQMQSEPRRQEVDRRQYTGGVRTTKEEHGGGLSVGGVRVATCASGVAPVTGVTRSRASGGHTGAGSGTMGVCGGARSGGNSSSRGDGTSPRVEAGFRRGMGSAPCNVEVAVATTSSLAAAAAPVTHGSTTMGSPMQPRRLVSSPAHHDCSSRSLASREELKVHGKKSLPRTELESRLEELEMALGLQPGKGCMQGNTSWRGPAEAQVQRRTTRPGKEANCTSGSRERSR
eukprot:TRINITY_DN11222_c0_g1_i3.p1 TRINITY_DN11222_c0_g1~~TRINITY_DN11222_c0_g1_i3.p1  ORF type:complete len:768 (-),score=111.22 TRINITY_DN11222_c0_g1_i3:134-2437(-)